MRECPFIDDCTDEVAEWTFKNMCRIRLGVIFGFKQCDTYRRLIRQKQGKYYQQTPRDWKKEIVK